MALSSAGKHLSEAWKEVSLGLPGRPLDDHLLSRGSLVPSFKSLLVTLPFAVKGGTIYFC